MIHTNIKKKMDAFTSDQAAPASTTNDITKFKSIINPTEGDPHGDIPQVGTALRLPIPRVYQYLVDKTDEGEDRKPSQVLEPNEDFAANDPKFIVQNEVGRKYLIFESYSEFKRWFELSPIRTLHEVIRCVPQKLKFDIDAKSDKLDLLEDMLEPENCSYEWWASASPRERKARRLFDTIIGGIVECFSETYGRGLSLEHDFAISDSTDATKFSRHIVIHRFHVADNKEAAFFTARLLTLLPENMRCFLDSGVNRARQHFRLCRCHKVGSRRTKTVILGTEDMMAVSQVNGLIALPALYIRIETYQNDQPSFDESVILEMAAPYADGLVFRGRKDNMFFYNRERPDYCLLCERVHHKDNTLFVTVNDRFVRVRCFHSSFSVCIGRIADDTVKQDCEKTPRLYGDRTLHYTSKPKDDIPTSFSVEQYCEQYLRQFDFHGDRFDTLLIKANMGTGKTKQMLQYVESLPVTDRIILISFRKSFSDEVKGKLGDTFVDYRTEETPIKAPRLIIQVESLHKLELPVGQNVLLLLDESESVIQQLENAQMARAGTLRACWETFQWLVTYSKKVIAMDAMAGHRTYSLLESARKTVHMQHNTYTVGDHTDIYYASREAFLAAIYKEAPLARERPFVVVSTSKKRSDAIVKRLRELNPTARLRSYSSDSTDEERKDFENVSHSWQNVDILVYTSTITAGCSFELPRFQNIFAYFSDRSVDFKTSIQMLGRVRDVGSRSYQIFIKETYSVNLPKTIDEIEQAMIQRAAVCRVATNPLNMPTVFTEEGKHEFLNRDLYFRLHVGNIAHKCQSQHSFRKLFQRQRAAMGIKLVRRTVEMDALTIKTIRIEHDNTVKELKDNDHKAIAQAAVIDDKIARRLTLTDVKTVEQRASLTAFQLTECYQLTPGTLTPTIVKTYNKPETMRTFRNIRRLTSQGKTVACALAEWQQKRADDIASRSPFVGTEVGSFDELTGGDSLPMCLFAAKTLNLLLTEPNEKPYCDTVERFLPKTVLRIPLTERLDKMLADLRANVDSVSLMFGIDKKKLLKRRNTLKAKLCCINSMLGTAFGIKIIASEQNVGHKYELFTLAESSLFPWDVGLKRYTIQILEGS